MCASRCDTLWTQYHILRPGINNLNLIMRTRQLNPIWEAFYFKSEWHCIIQKVNIIKDERLQKCFRLKKTKEIWKIDALLDPVLEGKSYSKGHYWVNWQNWNIYSILDKSSYCINVTFTEVDNWLWKKQIMMYSTFF